MGTQSHQFPLSRSRSTQGLPDFFNVPHRLDALQNSRHEQGGHCSAQFPIPSPPQGTLPLSARRFLRAYPFFGKTKKGYKTILLLISQRK